MRETVKNRSTMPLMALAIALAMALALVLASVALGAEGNSSEGGKSKLTAESKKVARVVKSIQADKMAATAAVAPPQQHVVDTDWVGDFDGGCRAKAHVEYYPGNDQAHIETTVNSPYLFAACRVNTQVYVQTRGATYPGAVHYAMACAVLDPSCASTRQMVGDYFGQTPQLTAFVDSVNDALEAAGLPRSYTRAQAVTGIRVVFTKA